MHPDLEAVRLTKVSLVTSDLYRLHHHFVHHSLKPKSRPECRVTIPRGKHVVSISCAPQQTRAGMGAEDRERSLSCQQLGDDLEGNSQKALFFKHKNNPATTPTKTITDTTAWLETGWAEGMK